MATTKSSNTRKAASSGKSGHPGAESSAVGKRPLSPELRAELERWLAEESADRQRRQAEVDAAIERKARDGITLRGKRLEQARHAVGDMILSAASVHELAGAVGEAGEQEAGRLITALENVAKVICRKGDVLDALLNNCARGCMGNFEDEFIPLTEERAAELERMEAGRLNHE
jgi:hypothetical protein